MKILNKFSLSLLAVVLVFGPAGAIKAATAVNLGTAGNFAVLAGSTITNTGSSVISGDLGLSPGSSVTGFPPGTLSGMQQVANTAAIQAKNDLVTAFDAAGQTPVATIPAELGGTTLTPGVYDSTPGMFGITGTLTLDGQGDPNAVFIFKTASTLITEGASNVSLINGAQACNVFWQVGSSATLGANSTFKGNILALVSATLTTGANVEGSVLARNGAVTLDSNTVAKATCTAPIVAPTPPPAPVIEPTPAPVVTPISAPAIEPIVISAPAPTPATAAAALELPQAGIGPVETSRASWMFIIAIGISVVLFGAYLGRKKQII